MIQVQDKEVTFSRFGKLALRRRAAFAHTCPKCGNLIHGLLIHDPDEPLEPVWRAPEGHPQEINLKLFAEGSIDYIVPPDYKSSFLSLSNGQTGQYFFDGYHFSMFGYRFHGRCKYSRGVFQFDQNTQQEALRLMGLLKLLYGTEEPKWVKMRERVASSPEIAEMILNRVHANAATALDSIGGSRPVVLISKEDWDFGMFNELVDSVIQETPAQQGA